MVDIRQKPKVYGPLTVRTGATHPFVIETAAGARTAAGPVSGAEVHSPSDHLMAAVGACLAVSLRTAAERMRLDAGAVEMSIEAFVDGDLPRRFNRFEVAVRVPGVADRARAEALLAKAKGLCTVSQSLGSRINLTLAA